MTRRTGSGQGSGPPSTSSTGGWSATLRTARSPTRRLTGGTDNITGVDIRVAARTGTEVRWMGECRDYRKDRKKDYVKIVDGERT